MVNPGVASSNPPLLLVLLVFEVSSLLSGDLVAAFDLFRFRVIAHVCMCLQVSDGIKLANLVRRRRSKGRKHRPGRDGKRGGRREGVSR